MPIRLPPSRTRAQAQQTPRQTIRSVLYDAQNPTATAAVILRGLGWRGSGGYRSMTEATRCRTTATVGRVRWPLRSDGSARCYLGSHRATHTVCDAEHEPLLRASVEHDAPAAPPHMADVVQT